MTPVTMPDSAVGSTIFTIVFHFGTPSAYEASRSSSGTRRNISSVERTTTGSMSSTRASDTANALVSNQNVVTHSANTNSAATIDGTPDRMSTMNVVMRANRPLLPYST